MKSLGKGLLCLIVLFCAINELSAQNSSVTIGPGDLKSSAVLWLVPTGGQGLLLPSVSTATRTAMSLNSTDEKGMVVFDNQLNKIFYWNGTTWIEAGGGVGGGSGTVTSVGLSLPTSVFGASTPVTTSGNLTSTFNSQTAATVFAAPTAAAGVPSFRALTNTDIPSLDAAKINSGSFGVARGGTGLTTAPANGQLLIGNGSTYALSTLTAGAGVNITNGAGTITISSAGLSNPMTTSGDIIFGGASGVPTRLAGTAGFLRSTGAAAPTWSALAATDIPNLDAAKINTGSFGIARGGTGLTAAPTNGQILIGNGTGYSLATLTQGAGVTIANGAGTVTISASGLSNPMTTTGDIIFGGATGTPTRLPGSAGVLKSTGAAAPTWSALAATDIPNLDAAKINTGSFGIARGGTGLTAAPTNGQILIGNGTGYSLATLTQGAGVTIANGAGTVTISASGLSNPMTTTGDIIFGGATGTPTRLPGSAGVLKSTGAAAPTWSALAATDIPNLDAAKITTGTFAVGRGGTGVTATPTNGQILIGNGTGYSLATLTQGSGVTIANAAGTITISASGLSNPMTASGDMIVGGASGTPTRLAIGAGVLRSNGATQSWTSLDLASTDFTGILPVANGGTGRATWDGLLLGSGGSISDISTGTNGQILKASGGSPSWQNFIVTDVEIQDNSIMNADINTAANIDGSKINTAFGNKNISTTGTLSSGAITATNLASINSVSYSWPASQGAANSILQNNGSGTLTWASVPTAFSASNAIIKGNAAGTAQVASSMTDDGTTVTSSADINITTGNFYKINNQNFVGLSGTSTTHLGQAAGPSSSGLHNTFVGFESGNATTSGEDNLFVGRRAGYSNTTAGYNTYLGKNSGYFNTTGRNTFVGWSAGYNTAGMLQGGSTFVGANAGYASTGSYNTFIGERAGENNVGGEFNVFLGRLTGQANIAGDQITLLGHGADVIVDNLTNATAIGYNAEVSTSSSLVLGGTGAQVVNVGIGVTGPSTDLHVVHGNNGGAANGDGLTIQNGAGSHSWTMFVSNSTGNLVLMQDLTNTVLGQFDDSNGNYAASSDRRLKKNIVAMESVLPRISGMNIRRYHYKKQNDSELTNIGVIAQEVKEVFPELVKYAPEQDVYTVDYMSMAPLAIKAIQEQQTMIEELQKKVSELQSKLKKEESTNSELSAKLESLLDDVEAIKKSVGLDQKAQNTPKK